MKLTCTSALIAIGASSIGQNAFAQPNIQHSKPNIVLIQMDDLGWDDLSSHQNQYVETKHIDALRSKSMVFERFYVNPVSSASRASLLTGRFFLRTGVSHVHGGNDFINLKEQLLPQVLKEAGYQTAMFGKWHSGKTNGYFPWQRGFDTAFFSDLYKHRNASGYLNGQKTETELWSDALITNFGIEYIKKQSKPFFLYLSYLTPHTPLDAPQHLIEKYIKKGLSSKLSTLYAMIEMADIEIGRLMLNIAELGLEENTIILFMSDNGPARNNNDFTDEDREIRYQSKMRGHKGDIFENGVKSPLFISWKNKFENTTSQQLCDITDIFPTLIELTNSQKFVKNKLDGISIVENLTTGKLIDKVVYNYSNIGWANSHLPYTPKGIFNEYAPLSKDDKKNLIASHQIISITRNNDKLLLNPTLPAPNPAQREVFLYNTVVDEQEINNIIDQHPIRSKELEQNLLAWFEEIKQEPHAFETPVFIIGGKSSEIPAYGASQMSKGLSKTINTVNNWSNGSELYFKTAVEKKAAYYIEVIFDSNPNFNDLIFIVNGKKNLLSRNSDTTFVSKNRIILTKNISEVGLQTNDEHSTYNKLASMTKIVLRKKKK